VLISFASDMVSGLQSPGLDGEFGAEQGLQGLLQ